MTQEDHKYLHRARAMKRSRMNSHSIHGLAGISLFLILMVPPLITFSWLEYRKSAIRNEVRSRITKGFGREELLLLKFSIEESRTKLRWKGPGEFEYKRRMYDVVETIEKGDTLYLWCWWDVEETSLNRRITELVARTFRDDPQKKEKQERLQSYFKSLFCSNLFNWNSVPPSLTITTPCICIDLYISLAIPPPKPPPRLS